jgi:hypothetical protein
MKDRFKLNGEVAEEFNSQFSEFNDEDEYAQACMDELQAIINQNYPDELTEADYWDGEGYEAPV